MSVVRGTLPSETGSCPRCWTTSSFIKDVLGITWLVCCSRCRNADGLELELGLLYRRGHAPVMEEIPNATAEVIEEKGITKGLDVERIARY